MERMLWLLNRISSLLLVPLLWLHLLDKGGVLVLANYPLWVRYLLTQVLLLAILVHGLYSVRIVVLESLALGRFGKHALDFLISAFFLVSLLAGMAGMEKLAGR